MAFTFFLFIDQLLPIRAAGAGLLLGLLVGAHCQGPNGGGPSGLLLLGVQPCWAVVWCGVDILLQKSVKFSVLNPLTGIKNFQFLVSAEIAPSAVAACNHLPGSKASRISVQVQITTQLLINYLYSINHLYASEPSSLTSIKNPCNLVHLHQRNTGTTNIFYLNNLLLRV